MLASISMIPWIALLPRRLQIQVIKLQLDMEYEKAKLAAYVEKCAPYMVKLKMYEKFEFARGRLGHVNLLIFVHQHIFLCGHVHNACRNDSPSCSSTLSKVKFRPYTYSQEYWKYPSMKSYLLWLVELSCLLPLRKQVAKKKDKPDRSGYLAACISLHGLSVIHLSSWFYQCDVLQNQGCKKKWGLAIQCGRSCYKNCIACATAVLCQCRCLWCAWCSKHIALEHVGTTKLYNLMVLRSWQWDAKRYQWLALRKSCALCDSNGIGEGRTYNMTTYAQLLMVLVLDC